MTQKTVGLDFEGCLRLTRSPHIYRVLFSSGFLEATACDQTFVGKLSLGVSAL